MKRVLIIGIGAGNPDYMTVQAINALNQVDVFFIMDKGAAKEKLIALRKTICERFIQGRHYRFAEASSPERVRDAACYQASVEDLNADKRAIFERLIANDMAAGECGAFLTWGDPTLYDSTIRIMESLRREGASGMTGEITFEVIPGISSVQALAAQHKIPLNQIGESVQITTGRRIASGFPVGVDTVVVMLDAEGAYKHFVDEDIDIYWGAYVGTPDEILVSGKLKDVAADIERVRLAAREANGWIMDTYLMRRRPSRAL